MTGLRSKVLFGKEFSWLKLASLIGQGAKVCSTKRSDSYDFEAFRASQNRQDVMLFALDGGGRLKVFSSHQEMAPEAGWTVISLANEKTGD